MFLLNIAADEALFIKSGMLFHKRLPRNVIESMPNIMLFAAGICNKSFVLRSYLVSFLTKHSCINDGLVQLSVLYISITVQYSNSTAIQQQYSSTATEYQMLLRQDWNDIPANIREIQTLGRFKKRTKSAPDELRMPRKLH